MSRPYDARPVRAEEARRGRRAHHFLTGWSGCGSAAAGSGVLRRDGFSLGDPDDVLEVALGVQARVLVLQGADALLELCAAGMAQAPDPEDDQHDGERAGGEGDRREDGRRNVLRRTGDGQRLLDRGADVVLDHHIHDDAHQHQSKDDRQHTHNVTSPGGPARGWAAPSDPTPGFASAPPQADVGA